MSKGKDEVSAFVQLTALQLAVVKHCRKLRQVIKAIGRRDMERAVNVLDETTGHLEKVVHEQVKRSLVRKGR